MSDRASDRGGGLKTAVLSILILLVGAALTGGIFYFEPTAQRTESTRETAMLVDTTYAERGTFRPTISATGVVMPAREVVLRPRVSGEIVGLSDDFTPGGYVDAGETLVRLDPSDYENEVARGKSALAQAESELQLEIGRRKAAQLEFELLGEKLGEDERALVLREPQLASARAAVASARSALDLAELRLSRTVIRAPFDAHVLRRDVNVGSQVAPGDSLAHLVGVHTYWVEVTVPLVKLDRLAFPEDGAEGSPVRVRNRSAWAEGEHRMGRVYKLVGALAEQTRMARVLVAVEDPLARGEAAGRRPLMVGSFVEAHVEGRPIPDCLKLPREHVRKDDTVWVMADGELDVREVDVVFRDAAHAYIADGITESDAIVTTSLVTVVEGAPLRTQGGAAAPEDSP